MHKSELWSESCPGTVIDIIAKEDYVRLADLIEAVLPCTTPEIFTLRKNYTIVEAIDETNGKWPN